VDSQNKPNQHCNHHTRNGDPDNEANSLGHRSVIVVAMLVRFPRHTNREVHHFHCPLHCHIGRAAAEDNFGVFLSGLPQLRVLEIESVVAIGETVSGDSEGGSESGGSLRVGFLVTDQQSARGDDNSVFVQNLIRRVSVPAEESRVMRENKPEEEKRKRSHSPGVVSRIVICDLRTDR
jgi:hypothetical protein